jgi:hypothetical protein
MIMVYAEQLLKQAGTNQWFVQFTTTDPNFDPSLAQQQMQWFESQGLQLTQVLTVGQTVPHSTDFYHVNFASSEDARLTAYSAKFEDSDGASLNASTYQMFEWSYDGWISTNGHTVFDEFVAQTQPSSAPTGPAGP